MTATSLPGDPTINNPCYLTPGTGTEIILNQPSASANMTETWDTVTSFDPPHQSLSTRTPAADADLNENLLPSRTQIQTHAGMIVCLPSQQPRAQTSNSRPIPKSQKSKNVASSSQNDAGLHENSLPPTQNQTHGGMILCLPAQQPRPQRSNSRPVPKKRKPKNLASSSQVDAVLYENLLPPHNQSQDDAVLHENLLPPHSQSQTHDGSIACLPAPEPRAQTSKPRPIPRKRKPKTLASSGQDELDESPNTFWTLCPPCNMLYEYVNCYLNKVLKCPECQLLFTATRKPAPTKARVQKFFAEASRSWTQEEDPASVFNADTSGAAGEKTTQRSDGSKGAIACEDPDYDSSATE